jgi:hypothetical protein
MLLIDISGWTSRRPFNLKIDPRAQWGETVIYHIPGVCIERCKIIGAEFYPEGSLFVSLSSRRRDLTIAHTMIRANISHPCHRPKLML